LQYTRVEDMHDQKKAAVKDNFFTTPLVENKAAAPAA
jgi:hypothetical protein